MWGERKLAIACASAFKPAGGFGFPTIEGSARRSDRFDRSGPCQQAMTGPLHPALCDRLLKKMDVCPVLALPHFVAKRMDTRAPTYHRQRPWKDKYEEELRGGGQHRRRIRGEQQSRPLPARRSMPRATRARIVVAMKERRW